MFFWHFVAAAAAVAYTFLGIVVASNGFKIKLSLSPAPWPVSPWPALGARHRNIFAARLQSGMVTGPQLQLHPQHHRLLQLQHRLQLQFDCILTRGSQFLVCRKTISSIWEIQLLLLVAFLLYGSSNASRFSIPSRLSLASSQFLGYFHCTLSVARLSRALSFYNFPHLNCFPLFSDSALSTLGNAGTVEQPHSLFISSSSSSSFGHGLRSLNFFWLLSSCLLCCFSDLSLYFYPYCPDSSGYLWVIAAVLVVVVAARRVHNMISVLGKGSVPCRPVPSLFHSQWASN